MSLQTTIIDTMAMERMVLQFRESEYHLEGFETLSVDRKPQALVFRFKKVATEDELFTVAYGMFEGRTTNMLTGHIELHKGNKITITYTLKWSKLDDDDTVDGPSPPGVGRTLQFEFSFSNAV